MFTQCPECQAAFRITAELLQQARGQVRCGSCGSAFNALDHLSEEPPESAATRPDAAANNPDVSNGDDDKLLETLNQLAGPEEVRIEDTGIEWLVVDDDPDDKVGLEGTGSMKWFLEGANEQEAGADDAADAENAETTEQQVLNESAVLEFGGAAASEPRYDDNTPLPDDFEELHDYVPQRRATDVPAQVPGDDEPIEASVREAGPDLELSEPDEWTDLLEEFGGPPERNDTEPETGVSDAPVPNEIEGAELPSTADDIALHLEEDLDLAESVLETEGAEHSSDDSDDDTDDDSDDNSDDNSDAESFADDANIAPETAADTQESTQQASDATADDTSIVASQLDELLEAMGSGKFKVSAGQPATSETENAEETGADEETVVRDLDSEPPETVAADTPDASSESGISTYESDLEPQRVYGGASADDNAPRQADPQPPGIDASDEPDSGSPVEVIAGADAIAGQIDAEETEDVAENDAVDLEIEAVPDDAAIDPEFEAIPDDATDHLDDASDDEPEADVNYEETTGEFERAIADAEEEILAARADAEVEVEDGEVPDEELALEEAGDVAETRSGFRMDLDEDIAALTGNMEIDPAILKAMQDGTLDERAVDDRGTPLVETIVMEGDFVRGALLGDEMDEGLDNAQQTASVSDPGSLIDTYISKRKPDPGMPPPSQRNTVIGIILLAVLLLGQALHSARESLATNSLVANALAPVYDGLGQKIIPDWNVRGWQFEATTGSTDETDSVLTVSSRIANRSEAALPYPLVHISLTDRYEEIVGSRILEPTDYLQGVGDNLEPIAAGASFTAVIQVPSPSADATGFKLNVCYRQSDARIRCAIEDFLTP